MKKILIICCCISLFACKKDSNISEGTAHLNVMMTDSPGAYDKVNIDLKGIEIHSSGGEQKSGWIALNTNLGVYNLLELTNGIDTLIGSQDLPSGKISQIRLVLGNNNSLVIDGQQHHLNIASADESGLKLQVHQDLEAGITYNILLDFDAAKSIIQTGSNTYKLKPVIRTITSTASGAIKGIALPPGSHPAIFAINGNDTLGTYPDSTGKFLIKGVAAGTYSVKLMPVIPYKDTVIASVEVTNGSIKDLGIITLKQ